MDLREKLRLDWTRRALADAGYWACQTAEVEEAVPRREAEADLAAILDGLDLGTRAAVLEVGCGVGRLCGPLAERFVAVVGTDISPAMLEAARVLQPERPSLRYILTDGVRLPFPRQAFDLVYSFGVLQHVDPAVVRAVLGQMRRVVKPGGTVRFQGWLGAPGERPPPQDTLRLRTWSQAELEDWVEAAGLALVEIASLPAPPAEAGRRPVLVTARAAGLARVLAPLPDVAERSSAAEIAQEWGLLLHLVQKAAAAGELRRALHAVRAGNRLLPEQAVGWWVEARLLAAAGQQDDALLALDRLDRLEPRDEDAQVRQAADALRQSLGGEE